MKIFLHSTIVALLIATVAASSPQQPTAADWTVLTTQLEQSVRSDDAAGVRRARVEALRILAAGPAADHAPLVHYAIAYAGWRLSTTPNLPEREREDLLDEAETQLKRATQMNPRFAEGFALLSGVLGLKIANSPLSGMLLGPRASGAVAKAVALEPDNPRVLVMQGISKFNTPGMFGGSKTEAETLLRRALERFTKEPADKPFPAWGRFDAHVWLGQALADRGDKTSARAQYDKALEIAPQSGWVRHVLMPALDKR